MLYTNSMTILWRQDWFWGVIALVLLGLALFGLYSPKPNDQESLRLYAVFDDVAGLRINSPIRLSGFVVGYVKAITVRPDLRIQVEMLFDNTLEIPDDSDVRIATNGMFAMPQLNLNLGGGFDLLADGDEFLYAQSGIDFMRLFEQIIQHAAEPQMPETQMLQTQVSQTQEE